MASAREVTAKEQAHSSPLLLSPPTPPAAAPSSNLRLAVCSTLMYFLAYFLRYPVYMLPLDVVSRPLFSINGTSMALQEALSLSFGLGLGLGKLPAVKLMSSAFFFRNRMAVLAGLQLVAYLALSVPVAITDCNPWATVLGQFVSCMLQSGIYGGIVTYLEGRRSTEALLAAMTFSFTFAGSASRGTGVAVLAAGVPPRFMPLAIGGVAVPLILALLFVLDRSAPPSAEDVAARKARTALTREERRSFLMSYWPGLVLLVLAYSLVMCLRTMRDLFSRELLTAANDGVTPPSIVFLLLDGPAAVVSASIITAFVRVADNRKALLGMLTAMVAFLVLCSLSTLAFSSGLLGGIAWQMLFGVSMSGASCFLTGGPVYDRLVAASNGPGATSILIYLSDGSGYAVYVAMMLWKAFFAGGGQLQGLLLERFLDLAMLVIVVSATCFTLSVLYFRKRLPRPAGAEEPLRP